MTKIRAAITGIAGYVPEDKLTNADLEKMVDTNDEWIRARTGIQERRIVKDPTIATSDLGAEAVRELLRKTGTKPEEVDMLVCGTVTADYRFPDAANMISYKVGLPNAVGYDVNAACSGFLFTLITASQFIETGKYKKIVVVGADMMSRIVDYEDRATCILFGDAAGAVLLEPNSEGYGIHDSIMKADGVGLEHLYLKAGGARYPITHEAIDAREQFAYQNGRPVFKSAVRGMSGVVKQIIEQNDLTPKDIDWVTPHQANQRIIEAVANMMDFPMERVMVNIHKYGNTTSATIPLCLWEWESQLKKGDRIVLTAFGGGYTWGSILLTWAYDGE